MMVPAFEGVITSLGVTHEVTYPHDAYIGSPTVEDHMVGLCTQRLPITDPHEKVYQLIQNEQMDVNYASFYDEGTHSGGFNALNILIIHTKRFNKQSIYICQVLLANGINLNHECGDGWLYDFYLKERLLALFNHLFDDERRNKSLYIQINICHKLWKMIFLYRGGLSLKRTWTKLRNEMAENVERHGENTRWFQELHLYNFLLARFYPKVTVH